MGWDVAHERKHMLRYNIASAAALKELIDSSSFFTVVIHMDRRIFLMKKINTKTLVLISLFAAASIVLARFFVIWLTNSARISFGNIPIILAGLLFGPLAGAFTGAVADIMGAALFSPLGWYPPITLPVILTGIIPALLKPILLKKLTLVRIYGIIIVSNIITGIGLTTWLLSGLYGTGYFELLPIRVPLSLLVTAIEGPVVYLLYKRLSKEVVH